MKSGITEHEIDLLERVKLGNREAYKHFIRTHQEQVFRLCCSMLKDPFEAKHQAMIAFTEFFLHLNRIENPAGYKSYLLTIARNLCLDRLRKTKREVPVPPSGDEDPLETTLENIPYPDEDSPEKAFEEEKPRRRLRTLVNAKMDELPDDQKRALYLVHFKKLSHEEASRHLGCSPVNSRKLVHRGMQNLVRALTRDKIHLLPSGIRESVEQVYFKGLSYQQTSRKLGCSEYDVKAMMQKGLQILKEALHEEVEK